VFTQLSKNWLIAPYCESLYSTALNENSIDTHEIRIPQLSDLVLQIPGGIEWIIIIAIIVIMFFGVKKIPELARNVGRASVEYKKARIEVDREISRLKEDTTEDMDRKKLEEVADKLEIDYGSMTDEEIRNAIEKEINKGNKYLNNLVMHRDLLKHKTRLVQFH
jgi:sec-independent protein translocase protein TatA